MHGLFVISIQVVIVDFDQIVDDAQNQLSNYGIEVGRPAIVREGKVFPKSSHAWYNAKFDTIIVNSNKDRDRVQMDRAQVYIEHELLHRWQFGSSVDMRNFKQIVRMINTHYDEAKKFLHKAGFPLPENLDGDLELKEIKLILAFINLGEDYPDLGSGISERLEEIEEETQRIHQKMREEGIDLDDESDKKAQRLNERLMSLQEEEKKLNENLKKARKDLIENEIEENREEIERATQIIEERKEFVESRKTMVRTIGEAMSWYWTFYRTEKLQSPPKKVKAAAKKIFKRESYKKDAIIEFRDIYNAYHKASQRDKNHKQCFLVGWEKAIKKVEENERAS